MKNTIMTLSAAFFLASLTLVGCSSSTDKVEEAQENVGEAQTELKDAKEDAQAASAEQANEEEWKAYKEHAEMNIAANEAAIADLKKAMNKPGKVFDKMYAQRIDALEQRNADLKSRINTYEKNEGNWASFKREFSHDMDELGQSLKDFAVNNKN